MSCELFLVFFFFKQKTAYEMRISDWSSDVCSSDLLSRHRRHYPQGQLSPQLPASLVHRRRAARASSWAIRAREDPDKRRSPCPAGRRRRSDHHFTLAVYSDSLKSLRDNMSIARAALADTGMVAAREGAALEAAYWSQLVGNFAWRARPAPITSLNFAAFSPFHPYPPGLAPGTP